MRGYTLDAPSLHRLARSVIYTEQVRQNQVPRERRHITAASKAQWFRCRSTEGSLTLPAYAVVEVHGEESAGPLDELVYQVRRLTSTWPARIAVLGGAEIAAGGYGALTFDPTYALADAATEPQANEAWGIKPNETKLFKGFPGFRALGRTHGTGSDQRAFVRQAWPQLLWAVAPSNIAARSGATPGSGTVNIQTLASGSFAATGFSTTALNASGAAIVSGKYLQIVEIEGRWAANYEDCAGA